MGLSVPINLSNSPDKSSAAPKSLSISQLLKAGKLVKPSKQSLVDIELETFDIERMKWIKKGSYQFDVKEDKFASGAFRDAFEATATNLQVKPGLWVIKQYQEQAVDAITSDLNMTLEDHTRKQVQMHMAARSITKLFSMKVPSEFGETFQYNKAYYAVYKDQPVTVEEFVDGEFQKYVNNDGSCMIPPSEDFHSIYKKAECTIGK